MIFTWYIYKITSPNDRIYIGQTNDHVRRKSRYAKLDCKEQPCIYRSLKKYGFNNHTFELIDEFKGTNSECNSKEMFWIRTYMSNIKKYPKMRGMNLTDGGGGIRGYKHKESAKKSISEKKLGKPNLGWVGKKHSEETKKKFSEILKGNQRWLGKTHSQETKNKISLSAIGRSYKKVLQYDLSNNFIKEWDSITSISKNLNCHISTISLNLRGKTNKAKGYIFKYK